MLWSNELLTHFFQMIWRLGMHQEDLQATWKIITPYNINASYKVLCVCNAYNLLWECMKTTASQEKNKKY